MMNLKIDKKLIKDLKEKWTEKCLLDFINAWCKWKKLEIKELTWYENELITELEWIGFYSKKENIYKFKDAKIKLVNGKLLFSSPLIKESCSCLSSFNFGEKTLNKISLAKLKETFTNKLISVKDNVTLDRNQTAVIFRTDKLEINIDTNAMASNKIFWIVDNSVDINIRLQRKSKMTANFVYLWDKKSVHSKIHWLLNKDNSNLEINIICLVQNNDNLEVDWVIEIKENTKKMVWHLKQENILLWKKWKVRWIPKLLVWTNDVEASHSCKFEFIDENKLFYLKSRWIRHENARHMIIDSIVEKTIWEIKHYDINLHKEIKDYIFNKIK